MKLRSLRLLSTVTALASVRPARAQPIPAANPPVEREKAVQLDAFTVQADAYNGYNAMQSSSGTRIAVDLKSMPFTLDVVPMVIWTDFSVCVGGPSGSTGQTFHRPSCGRKLR